MKFLIYALLAFFGFAGTARVGLFSLNRIIFGDHHETDLVKIALYVVQPILLGLTILWIPFILGLERGWLGPWGMAGAVWVAITVSTGVYWLIDRSIRWTAEPPLPGVRVLPSEIIRMRKAHIPFQSLRKLGAHNDVYDLEISRFEVYIPGLPAAFDGYRIGFITDTHVASFMRRGLYRECIEQLGRNNVDLVLFGGDFVSFRRHIPLMAELLTTGLSAPDGAWAVLGNHDYWADADGVVAALSSKGVRFLYNQSVVIERDGAKIDLVGIDEIYRGNPDVEAAFRKTDPSRPCLVLSHHPDIFRQLGNRRVDLLVCGHTHGGQIRLPLLGAIVVPSRYEARYAAGFSHRNGQRMYVSRGIGAIPPLRILCPPELPIFTLRTGSAAAPE